MRRQRTTYHSPLLSVEECGELIKKLKSAVNATVVTRIGADSEI